MQSSESYDNPDAASVALIFDFDSSSLKNGCHGSPQSLIAASPTELSIVSLDFYSDENASQLVFICPMWSVTVVIGVCVCVHR